MIGIDRLAYHSNLRKTDPVQKLFFAVLSLGVCLWADSIPISLAVLGMMIWKTARKGGIPLSYILKLLLIPMAFLVIGVLTVAVNAANNPDLFWCSLTLAGVRFGITHTGAQTAASLFFKALGAVSCLYYLSLTTPMVDILAGLSRLKVPKLLLDLMGLTYRFIFVLLETAETIITAQRARLGYATLSTGFRSLGALTSSLFLLAYRRFDQVYTALEMRGYEGELNPLDVVYEQRWSGYLSALLVNGLLIAAALWLHKGGF